VNASCHASLNINKDVNFLADNDILALKFLVEWARRDHAWAR
jgi:hypothetical protein